MPDSLRPGTQLNGIYEIDGLLASGGMGEVYKGHAIQTGHRVAIKVIRPEFAGNEVVRSLFRNEASSLYHLHHEAIVRYFIFGVDPTLQRAYLAMDFVEGESLSQVLRRGPMPVATVARLAARLADGLHAAHTHRQGITHRDVSPDNIIIRDGDVGAAMIIDFGIARSTRAGTETVVDSGFAGKYNYVSPEQLGLFGGEVTPKSDIYSLGLVLLAALRGSPVDMSGSQADVVAKRQRVPPLDGVDARVRPILAPMLRPDPAARPESMLDVARSFRAIVEPRKPLPPYKAAVGLTAAAALAGVAVGAYLFLAPQHERTIEPGSEERPAPATLEPDLANRERITRYIETYDGGPCFHIDAIDVTSSSAAIDGFGVSAVPFDALDRAFEAAFGFEARIRARLIRPDQCPVLTFLDRVQPDARRAPRVELATSVVPGGRPLTGSIGNVETGEITLLLVFENGSVHDVTRFLRQDEARGFDIPMEKPDQTGEPRLLVALSSPRALPSSSETMPRQAGVFFEKLLSAVSAEKEQLGVAMRYFQVE